MVPHFAARNLLSLRVLRLVASLTRVFVRFVVFQSQFIVVGTLDRWKDFFSRLFLSRFTKNTHTERLWERKDVELLLSLLLLNTYATVCDLKWHPFYACRRRDGGATISQAKATSSSSGCCSTRDNWKNPESSMKESLFLWKTFRDFSGPDTISKWNRTALRVHQKESLTFKNDMEIVVCTVKEMLLMSCW